MKKLLVILVLCIFSTWASAKSPEEQLQCHYLKNGDYIDSDPCFYLKNKQVSIIFNPDYYFSDEQDLQPLIAINGKVTRLKLLHSSDNLSKVPRDQNAFNLKGDSHFYVYEAKKIKLEYKKTVVRDGCNSKNENGIYETDEKCCYSTYRAKIKVTVNGKTHEFDVKREEGGG